MINLFRDIDKKKHCIFRYRFTGDCIFCLILKNISLFKNMYNVHRIQNRDNLAVYYGYYKYLSQKLRREAKL